MEVTREDIVRACSSQYNGFVQCSTDHRGHGDEDACKFERVALEECATAVVQTVRAINAHCGAQHAAYVECVKGADEATVRDKCKAPFNAFWACAEAVSPSALTDE